MFLEELAEYRAAVHNHDIVEIADALTDLLYGTRRNSWKQKKLIPYLRPKSVCNSSEKRS